MSTGLGLKPLSGHGRQQGLCSPKQPPEVGRGEGEEGEEGELGSAGIEAAPRSSSFFLCQAESRAPRRHVLGVGKAAASP